MSRPCDLLVSGRVALKNRKEHIMNIITIELCAEDRARLDRIISGLEAITGAAPVASNPDQVTLEEVIAETPRPKSEDAAPPWTDAAEVTLSDIQQKVVTLSAAGKKSQAREIVKAYAERVTLLPKDKYVEVMGKLSALDG